MINVPRRILYFAITAAIFTGGAVTLFPNVDFVGYVEMVLGAGTLALLVLAGLAFLNEDGLTMKDKNLLMNGFLVAVLVPSFYTAGAFIHESQTSWSQGEIHWHADFEVIVDGERQDLIDPGNFCGSSYMCNLNDRTGSTEYHDHNDNRIHLEGVFKERDDATLSAFFETFGGTLTQEKLVMPTDDGWINVTDSGNKTLKVIVENGVGSDRNWRFVDPESYVISPYKQGPLLDNMFIIYDDTPREEALQDLRGDGKYKGMGLVKTGEGF